MPIAADYLWPPARDECDDMAFCGICDEIAFSARAHVHVFDIEGECPGCEDTVCFCICGDFVCIRDTCPLRDPTIDP